MQRRGARCALLVAAVLASCSLETEGLWLDNQTGGSGGQAGWSGAAGASFSGGTAGSVPSDASATGGVAGVDASGGAAGADDGGGGVAGEKPALHCASYPGSAELLVNGSTHCYWLSATTATQSDAMAACGEKGGYLATLVLQAEHDLVASLAQSKTIWLGLSRPSAPSCTKGDYKWMTGEVAVFDGWDSNDPDCSGTAAAMVETGRWRDRSATSPYLYACEVGPLLQ